MNQQAQTLNYFSAQADDWQSKATRQDYSVIENRHAAVLAIIARHGKVERFLDIGCGTGQLSLEVARRGISAKGVDFAPEMIALCKANKGAAELPVEFECASVFDVALPAAGYDVISAQGLIEYISPEQFDVLLATVAGSLRKGGVLALGTRNRLFNLHSLNAFTELELALKTTDWLLTESVAIQTAASQEAAIAALSAYERVYPQPTRHPITGIEVDTRHQYSPADLFARMRPHGLKPRALYPVHFHALPLGVMHENGMMQLHRQCAKLAATQGLDDFRYVPFSSSFVIEAEK